MHKHKTLLRLGALALAMQLALPAQAATETARHAYDMPAQPLGQALAALAAKTGLLIASDARLLAGRQAPALQGSYSTEEALARLLADTDLVAIPDADGRYTLKAAHQQSGSEAMLPVVQVTASVATDAADNGQIAHYGSTATKTSTPLRETARSISVISRVQMDARNTQTIADALLYTAGVFSQPYGYDPRYDWPLMRGFSALYGTYLNGLALQYGSYAIGRMEPYGQERVEVLKGPASVLYGKVGPGGIINMVSKRPGETPLHEVGITVGNHDRRQLDIDLGDRLDDEGRLRYRVTGIAREADTYVDDTMDDRLYIAPSLSWTPSKDTRLTVLASHQRDRTSPIANGTYSPHLKSIIGAYTQMFTGTSIVPRDIPRERNIGTPDFDKFKRAHDMAGYELEHKLDNNWELQQNVRYERLQLDYWRTQLNSIDASTFVTGVPTLLSLPVILLEDIEAISADQQARHVWRGEHVEHRLLFGVDYLHKTFIEKSGTGPADSITLTPTAPVYGSVAKPPIDSRTDSRQSQIGAYVQDQIKLRQKYVLTTGLRHDWVRSHSDAKLGTGSDSHNSDSAYSGHAGILYLGNKGISPYASYATSFLPTLGMSATTGQAYEPETAQQYEVGVKLQPSGSQTSVTAALFNLRQQNVRTRDPATLVITQAGEVETRGMELEFASTPAAGVSLNGSYTYTDGEVLKHTDPGLQGSRPDLLPRHTMALFAGYTLQSGPLTGLGIGAGTRYIGSSTVRARRLDTGTYTNFATPSYTLTDLALHYTLDRWRFALNINNLFDKEYLTYCNDQACGYGSAREVLASARYRW